MCRLRNLLQIALLSPCVIEPEYPGLEKTGWFGDMWSMASIPGSIQWAGWSMHMQCVCVGGECFVLPWTMNNQVEYV